MILAKDITTSSQLFVSLGQNIKREKCLKDTHSMRSVFRKDREELLAITLLIQLPIK